MARTLPFLAIAALAAALPFIGNDYWAPIGTRAAIYWVLVSGLNLVVGFGGQLAIGWVALLTVGAYTMSVLAGVGWPAPPALVATGATGALAGLIVGLPALRLRTFYFAMTTLGFATIVTQIALAWESVTGGGIGIAGPRLPPPFDTAWGLYALCAVLAGLCTWMTANIAESRFGRGLIAVRDAEVAAEATGISKPALLATVFLFAGGTAAVAGGLFAALQSYITPDAFTFDLSVLFFIAILIGGRGSVLGPLLGTILVTVLTEFAAPPVAWSTVLYAALLLVIVLVTPGGITELLDVAARRKLDTTRPIAPRPALLAEFLNHTTAEAAIRLAGVVLRFGAVRALDGLDLVLEPGTVHGLIGPNGSGKTTALNVIGGFYRPEAGSVRLGAHTLPPGLPQMRARLGIARTFQTPRFVGEASLLTNVIIGGTIEGRASFGEALFALPRHGRDERVLHDAAMLALRAVGLEPMANHAGRPAAAQPASLHGDRPGADAAAGFPDARRARRRTFARGDRAAG